MWCQEYYWLRECLVILVIYTCGLDQDFSIAYIFCIRGASSLSTLNIIKHVNEETAKYGFIMKQLALANHLQDRAALHSYWSRSKSHKTKHHKGEKAFNGHNKFNFNVCIDTLQNELTNLNLNHQIVRKKKRFLTLKQCENRMNLISNCELYGFEEWSRVIFRDEIAIQKVQTTKVLSMENQRWRVSFGLYWSNICSRIQKSQSLGCLFLWEKKQVGYN